MDRLPPPPTAPAPPPPPPKRRPWLIVGIAVAVALVVAGAVALLRSNELPRGSPTYPTASSPTPPPSPENLRAKAGSFEVRLSWSTNAGEIRGYDIERDGEIVGRADGDATSFVDERVIPGERYRYRVIAINDAGLLAPADVVVRTRSAPPATATLQGVFNVRLHPTSHSGFSSFDDKDGTAGWKLTPDCGDPPCDTKLRDINFKQLSMTLERRGGTYRGSAPITGVVSCGGRDVSATFTVTITATKADGVRGAWRITRFAGTMTQYSSSQLGCTSSSASYAVTGKLIQG